MNSPSTVLVVSASIGAGHDGYAAEIARRLRIAGGASMFRRAGRAAPANW